MNNAGIPGKPAKPPMPEEDDDIPMAVRDTPEVKPSRLKPILIIVALLGLGAISVLIFLSLPILKSEPTAVSSPEATPADIQTTANQNPTQQETDNILGHLPYEEALPSQLQPITNDGRIQLRTAAAEKFLEMSEAARRDGIILVAISGFRTLQEQEHLFFDIKEQRAQVASKRAEVSAPPGYSEHHTGYAVDIGDARTPATHLSPKFENTAAFRWLEENAARYSFELSFPRNNPQGISYEPWHWRFVGDSDSLETFYKAKELTPPSYNLPQKPLPDTSEDSTSDETESINRESLPDTSEDSTSDETESINRESLPDTSDSEEESVSDESENVNE